MYENFISSFPPDSTEMDAAYSDSRLATLGGFSELIAFGAGVSFGNGIVRIHSEGEMRRAQSLVEEGFPEYGGRVVPIAKDWLGRQYVALPDGRGDVVTQLLLLEPGSGDAFEIDGGIVDLFDVEFVSDPVTYLASDLFVLWKTGNPEIPASDECVGFKVPLFLGGDGVIENLEVTNEEVYWSIFGQLRAKVKNLPPGTGVDGIQID